MCVCLLGFSDLCLLELMPVCVFVCVCVCVCMCGCLSKL